MHGVLRKSDLVIAVVLVGWRVGFAVEPVAKPTTDGVVPRQQPSQQSSSTSALGPGAASTTMETLYNRKPADGSAAQSGANTAMIIQQKAMAADMLSGAENMIPPEFESYLNSAEVPTEDIKQYAELFKQTVDLLRDRRQASVAVANLYTLSDYAWDAGISRQLANRVLSFWDMRNNQAELLATNTQLQHKIKSSSRNADMISDEVRRKEQEMARREAGKNKGRQGEGEKSNSGDKNSKALLPSPMDAQQAVDGVMGKLQLTEEYFNSLDSRARMKLNEVEMAELEKKAKADFKMFVDILYQGRRHYHARVAADFYRVLFGDGDLPPEIAQAATMSSEIIRQTESDIEVFKFKSDQKKVASAAKILREAFFRSQYHPAFQAVMRVQKLPVADYYEQLQQVQAMIEAKDFVKLETTLQRMEKEVVDFDPTKPRALVEGVKREGQMRLGLAKLAAQQGQLEKAMEEFKAAAAAWPGNPDLDIASQAFFASQDTKNQGTEEFDRAIREQNYRLVFDKQLPFAASVRGDSKREDQLRSALERVKVAEMAYEKAVLMQKNRDPFGAWETLDLASTDWPEDSKLNKMRADVAVKASEFVATVSRAREAEDRNEESYALTWYLNAQRQYPPSLLANDGIERLSDQILGRRPKTEAKERRHGGSTLTKDENSKEAVSDGADAG